MKTLQIAAIGAISALFFVGAGATASAQGRSDEFHQKTDSGDDAHVLPSPDVLLQRGGTRATFAPPIAGPGVYAASYGSGNLIDHLGPEIPTAKYFAVYWNSSVANSVSAQIQAFAGNFGASQDYSIVQQYSSANTIAATLANQGMYVDTKSTQNSISDSSIRSWLTSLFNANRFAADANTVYGLYFPANMKISLNVFQRSCTSFCGYHSSYSYNGKRIKYAVFPYPNCSGCSISGLTAADMLTIVSSHEIREAVTDPQSSAWYDSQGYEGDDKCVWHNLYKMAAGGAWVQPEYSNKDGGCVVP